MSMDGHPDSGETRFRPPKRSLLKPAIIVFAVGMLAAVYFLLLHQEQPLPEPVSAFLREEGPPAIRLKPSLIVPGPMQNPHPAEDGGVARQDEAIIFRTEVRGSGYVMIALEAPDGRLSHVWGGRPDDRPRSGSQLLYDLDTGKVLAVDLGPHSGTTVTFVAALSSAPWDPFPRSGIPRVPRTYPNPEGEGTSPRAELLAWDRFTVNVVEKLPASTPAAK